MHNAVGVLAGKPLGALAAAMTAVLVITGCSPAARRHTARLTVRPVTSTAEHWGSLFGGGPGYFGQAASPAAVTLPGTVAEVGSSNSTEYALLTNGALYAWGLNTAGPLGDGHHRQSDVPVRVRLPGPVTRAAQGGSYWNNGQSLVLLSNGSVWAWGDGKRGQLGRRAARSRRSPGRVRVPAGVSFAKLATGGATSYAISSTGDVYAWGASYLGQIGNGKTRTVLAPVLVASGATSISATAGNVVIGVPGKRPATSKA